MNYVIPVLFLVLGSSLSHAQAPEKGLTTRLDEDLIHGGFPGLTVPWTCEVGVDGSKAHLPKTQQVRMTMNRFGDIGFKPDIFRSNLNIGNIVKKIFSPGRVDRSVDYGPCVNAFVKTLEASVTAYKRASCTDDSSKNPACRLSTEAIVAKVQKKTSRSPFLAEPTLSSTVMRSAPGPVRDPEVLLPDPVDPEPEITEKKISVPAPRELNPVTPGAKHFSFMGGGGEPTGPTTIFDNYLSRLGGFYQRPDWESTVAFNGGHATTEALLGSKFGTGATEKKFTPESFEAMIANYERQILSGQIKSGDQLFVLLNSHGNDGAQFGETHGLATSGSSGTSDLRNFSSTVSLDRLKKLVTLAEAKGVKLAIADLSCFSGRSLALASEKTCVISASGPKHYSYGNADSVFGTKFAQNLTSGTSLEDAYLRARKDSTDVGFPMISSGAGKSIQDKLYPLITKYLYTDQGTYRMLTPDLLDAFDSKACWSEDAEVQKLLDLTKEVEAIVDTDFRKFTDAVKAYHEYRQQAFKKLDAMGADALTGKRKYCDKKVLNFMADGCMEYTGKQLLTINFDEIIENKHKSSASAQAKSDFESFYRRVKQDRDALLAANPGLSGYTDFLDSIGKDFTNVYQLAQNVSNESKALYDKLYRSTPPETRANPCKDFVL